MGLGEASGLCVWSPGSYGGLMERGRGWRSCRGAGIRLSWFCCLTAELWLWSSGWRVWWALGMPVQGAWPGPPPHLHQPSPGCSRLPMGEESAPFFKNKSSWVAREMQGLLPALPGAVVWCQEEMGTDLWRPVLSRVGLQRVASPHVILVEWGSLWVGAEQRL